MDINHNQAVLAAVDAQQEGRELSRLEATVIAQTLCTGDDDFWFDVYYSPAKVAPIISAGIAQNYYNAQWAEKIAWDMLGTYCLNVPTV